MDLKAKEKRAETKAKTVSMIKELRQMGTDSEEYSNLLEQVLNLNMGLVYHTLSQTCGTKWQNRQKDDILPPAREGMIYAITHFDVTLENSFPAYAKVCIFSYVMANFNKHRCIVLPQGALCQVAVLNAGKEYVCDDPSSPFFGQLVFVNNKGDEVKLEPSVASIQQGAAELNGWEEADRGGYEEDMVTSVVNTDAIRKAQEKLEARDQLLLRLRYENDMKLREIAKLCEISIARTQQLLMRARERFRKELEKNDVFV